MNKGNKNRKLITVICDHCGVEFEKPQSEFNRNKKLGRKNFCSRSCCIKYNNIHNRKGVCSNRLKEHLNSINNNRKTIYTPYTYTMRSIRSRSKEYDINVEYLHNL